MITRRRIAQIALSVSNRRRSTAFYRDVLGMRHVFGTSEFRGPDVDRVQRMEHVASSTSWLIDNREMFQLEIFEFEHPQSRPLPADHAISDEGYNRLIIATHSLQSLLETALAAGGSALDIPFDEQSGKARHRLLRDPDGILLEVIEAPALVPADRSAQLVGLGLSSLDMVTSCEDFCEGFGFQPCADDLDCASRWNEAGQLQDARTLQLDDMYLVLSQYRNGRPRRSDHCLADIGIMNFAMGFPTAADFDDCYRRTTAMGMCPNVEPMILEGRASVTYHNDRQGFSVEMIYMDTSLRGLYGFAVPRLRDRVINKLLNWRSRRAYRRHLAQTVQASQGERT